MRSTHSRLTCLTVILTLLTTGLFSGCTSPGKIPVYQNPRFNPAEIDRITILPVVDLRQDKTVGIDLTRVMHGKAEYYLKRKRYEVVRNSDSAVTSRLTEEDLKADDCRWLQTVEPLDARWLMIFAVHDVTRKLTFGSTGNAEITGYLFDRIKGDQLWRDKGVGQAGEGGLFGMAMIWTKAGEALGEAAADCLVSFPVKN